MTVLPHPNTGDWQVFHGETSPAVTRLYLRMRLNESGACDGLRGEITGPFCRYARTLPAATRFAASIQSREVLAETVLVDPCFWTMEHPYLYRLRLTLERAGRDVWSEERVFGIRRLGVRGRRLYFEAKNWVLRGAFAEHTRRFDWDAWREQDLVAIVTEPDEPFCAEADHRGLLLGARITAQCDNIERLLRGWQRHPSVGLVLIPGDVPCGPEYRSLAPQTVFAAELTADSRDVPEWADAVVYPSTPRDCFANTSLPVLAVRRLAWPVTPAAIRAGCDALQRDLAGNSEFAGYLA